jgi:hypothetical protein
MADAATKAAGRRARVLCGRTGNVRRRGRGMARGNQGGCG